MFVWMTTQAENNEGSMRDFVCLFVCLTIIFSILKAAKGGRRNCPRGDPGPS